jgi:anti-sigma regulatory factor (Ser/Thr protein kinase)
MSMRHAILVYGDDDALLERVVPFLEAGLTSGESVVLVVNSRKQALLAEALGSGSESVSYIDRDSFYTRPEDALARYDLRLRQLVRDGATAVRAFAELPDCETGPELDAWITYEAIVNRALIHHPLSIVCGYDTREMPEALLESGLETHCEMLADDWEPSEHYLSPETVVTSRTPAPGPLDGLQDLPLDGGPGEFRARLHAALSRARVSESEARDMIAAAGEVLANAQQHGGGLVAVQVGRVDGRFVCEVADDGVGVDDPLAGFLPPRPNTGDGAGLWVARQLTRELELVPRPDGFSVRLWAAAAV